MDAPTCKVLRLRGLPYTASESEVEDEFFEGFSVRQVYLLQRNGKPTGEAYVEFSDIKEATDALVKKQRAHIGARYIEIFDAEEARLVAAIPDSDRQPSLAGFIVRLRGLPFSSVAEDVLEFFHPIIPVGESSGVLFSCAQDGRFTGEAFIELEKEEDFEAALLKNKQMLGSRYIETIRSTKAELFHIAHHRGFFTLVDGIKRYHGSNLVNTTDQYSTEGDFASNLPRIRTSGHHRGDDPSLNQAFTGLGISHRGQQFQQQQQQHYHPGAVGAYAQGNFPIGVMAQQSVMQMGIPQHHNSAGWVAMPTNQMGPATASGAFSPTGAGPLPQQHWDARLQTTGPYTTTPPQPQQQSMMMTPFVISMPQSTTWGASPATATYMTVPQQHQLQQRHQQQQQSSGANAWYGGTHMVLPPAAAAGGGGGAAMTRPYPGFQGCTNDSRRHYPRQQQQQGVSRPSPRSNTYQYQQQQQQYPTQRGNRGGGRSTSANSSMSQSAATTTASTSNSSKGAQHNVSLPQQPKQTPHEIPFFGTEKIIFGQGIPSHSSASGESTSANSSSGAQSASPPANESNPPSI